MTAPSWHQTADQARGCSRVEPCRVGVKPVDVEHARLFVGDDVESIPQDLANSRIALGLNGSADIAERLTWLLLLRQRWVDEVFWKFFSHSQLGSPDAATRSMFTMSGEK